MRRGSGGLDVAIILTVTGFAYSTLHRQPCASHPIVTGHGVKAFP